MSERKSLVSDTPVKLYELTGYGEGVIPQMEGLIEPAGEFVTRPWCKTHKSPMIHGWDDISDTEVAEWDYNLGYPCETWFSSIGNDDTCWFFDRLVEVIPDDH